MTPRQAPTLLDEVPCQERGLLFCFWHKSQPLARGRRESQGWLHASGWDDHDWDCGAFAGVGLAICIFPQFS